MVHKNIISPKSNCPVMGIVQDTLLGSQKLTQRDTFVERDMMMNMLMWVDDFDGAVPCPPSPSAATTVCFRCGRESKCIPSSSPSSLLCSLTRRRT